MKELSATDVISLLGLEPHPEGGWYRQTFADRLDGDGRAQSTAIYFLLAAGSVSNWHRIDSVEIWHWYAGSPLVLNLSRDGKNVADHTLGPSLASAERPQLVVPGDCWQRARSLGDWTLVGCTVAPGFQFSSFEMAPHGWEPG